MATESGRGRAALEGLPPGYFQPMFVFFSNRLGCMGSLVVSAVATLILLLLFGVIDFGGGNG